MSVDPTCLARARAAAATLAPMAASIEAARRMTPEAVRALLDSGACKLLVPRALGGAEASMATLLAVIEQLAHADGSAGWCAMIAATAGLMGAYLEPATAREIFAADDAIACAVFATIGHAAPVDGGYRVRGRWPFASGCEHAPWRMAGVLVDGAAPGTTLHVVFRADETRVIDTWDASGLRGTGSHDLAVDDRVVPAARAFSLFAPPRVDAPLYRVPFFGVLAASVAAVGVGIARAAIDALYELARSPQPNGLPRTLAHREVVQLEVARAEGELRAARAGLREAAEAVEHEVATRGAAGLHARAHLRIAAVHAVTGAAAAVDRVYALGGGGALRATSPLQRHFRDVHAVTQHAVVSSGTASYAARVLLGLELNPAAL